MRLGKFEPDLRLRSLIEFGTVHGKKSGMRVTSADPHLAGRADDRAPEQAADQACGRTLSGVVNGSTRSES